MTRIGILTCSNCTQDSNCASVVCLGDMRKRRGFFERYSADSELHLIGIINCAGCPTLAAPEKILRRVRGLASYTIDVLHFSYCMTALCPFIRKYQMVIKEAYPDLEIVLGTHAPRDNSEFRQGVKELLCPSVHHRQDMNDMIRGTLSFAEKPRS